VLVVERVPVDFVPVERLLPLVERLLPFVEVERLRVVLVELRRAVLRLVVLLLLVAIAGDPSSEVLALAKDISSKRLGGV
jgi:hypothetical protein